MRIADNLAQAISALGGLAGFTALGIELWARSNRRKRPPDDLLARLNWLNEAFGDIIAHSGREPTWFLDDERRWHESLLAITNALIIDDILNKHVSDARARYQEAFVHSPPPARTKAEESSELVRKMRKKQTDTAARGRAACLKAINRANELMRKY